MHEIPITPRSIDPFAQLIGEERTRRFADTLAAARTWLGGRTVWHVNSTARGGGVAEVLKSVLGYPAAEGIDMRWLAIDGSEAFFELTKRIHHLLHGSRGDGGPLGDRERKLYEQVLGREEAMLRRLVSSGDVVVLHDPQVVGLARSLKRLSAAIIWSCHIGADRPNRETRRAWAFLMPYVTETAAQTFTRSQYRWEVIPWRVAVLPPCIDAFAPKNQPLDENAVGAILDAAGIVPADDHAGSADFVRQDGTRGQVIHPADMIEDRRLIGGAPIICQVSRWDPLKDHVGVLRAFVSHAHCDTDAQLVLAGPSLGSVNDDPEGERTFGELVRSWEALARRERERVHICRVPMDDSEANAAVINALQRRSDVIVQKSLAEGFGLTVAEAMWKCRPTVASRVGGIQDQIEPGESGLLVDPTDPAELRGALTSLLSDPEAARQMGARGRRRVAESYLAPSYLIRQCTLIHEVLEAPVGTAHPVRDRVGPRSAIALGH